MPFIQLQFRRDPSTTWTTNNPVLAAGEMGIEIDTNKFKVGDGAKDWRSLSYGGLQGPAGPTGPAGSGSGSGSVGATGATGPAGPSGITTSYNFDGGNAFSVYTYGPAFDCGNSQ